MKQNNYKRRRSMVAIFLAVILLAYGIFTEVQTTPHTTITKEQTTPHATNSSEGEALSALEKLPVKGRAPKTGYKRAEFGSGWRKTGECTTRELVLARDLERPEIRNCKVFSGTLNDPYTGKTITFLRGPETSADIQIDHIVALSDAWQKGAQNLDFATREELANDPLELIAVDGSINQKKGDGDAATWLPPHKAFRCPYVARQIAVKQKYQLWVTHAEKEAMKRVLATCPDQLLPVPTSISSLSLRLFMA